MTNKICPIGIRDPLLVDFVRGGFHGLANDHIGPQVRGDPNEL